MPHATNDSQRKQSQVVQVQTLLPTSAASYHSESVYLQVQEWLGPVALDT